MNKKTATIIILAVILILAGIGIWFYFSQIKPAAETPIGGGEGGPIIFPDTGTITPGQTGGGGEQPPEGGTQGFRPKFIQITNKPVAGGVIIEDPETDSATVRYVERADGRMHEVDLSNMQSKRLSNTTIPKVYEALWGVAEDEVVLRYLSDDEEDITTFHAELEGSEIETEGSLRGTFLQTNIRSIALAPSAARLFYLLWNTSGATGVVANFDGTSKAQLWSSPLREWLASWPKADTIALLSKPSSDVPGSLFFVQASNGSERKILGDLQGLTALVNPGATRVLYSESSGTRFSTYLYTVSNRTSEALVVTTLPEKCVWSKVEPDEAYCGVPTIIPSGTYPDSWHQGKISFSDDFWKINAATGEVRFIANAASDAGIDIDAVNVSLDSSGKYLLFMNKRDLSLWVLQMTE